MIASSQLLHTTSPVKYGWCDESATYLSQGFGNLLFNLTNLRADVAFYYFTGGTYSPIVVNATTSSMYVSFRDENQPLRPRVVPTGNPDVFHLLWSSSSSQKPQLQWGVKTGKYTSFVSANSSYINRTSLCGGPANTTGNIIQYIFFLLQNIIYYIVHLVNSLYALFSVTDLLDIYIFLY